MTQGLLMSGSANDYFNIFEYYFDKFDKTYVDPIIFGEFTTVLICAYIMRLIMLLKIEANKREAEKAKGKYDYVYDRNVRMYLLGHVLFELLIAYGICYFLVKATNANPESYIINMIIGPSAGFMIALIVDIKVIMKMEENMKFGLVDVNLGITKVAKKSSENSGNSTNVTVNINSGVSDQQTNEIPKNKNIYLDKSIADSEDFNIKVIDAINDISARQVLHGEEITANSERLISTLDTLDKIRKADILDKKIVLKSMIYECLNKGYATPEENDKIVMLYDAYIGLGGNHEVKTLYKNHYIKLDIHNDRRVTDIDVEEDRRDISGIKKYEYGCLDNEVDEDLDDDDDI